MKVWILTVKTWFQQGNFFVSTISNDLILPIAVINPCDSEPCLNDGSCINLGPMVFKCACARGFRGRTCESKCFNSS